MRKADIKRDQSTQRRPAQPGILRLRQRPVCAIDPRLQLLDQQPPIAPPLAPSLLEVARRRVLRHSSKPRIGNAHQNQRLNLSCLGQPVCGRICIPRLARNVRGASIEKILPILQIQNREAALLLHQILRRQIHRHRPVIGQNLRMKLPNAIPGIRIQLIGIGIQVVWLVRVYFVYDMLSTTRFTRGTARD